MSPLRPEMQNALPSTRVIVPPDCPRLTLSPAKVHGSAIAAATLRRPHPPPDDHEREEPNRADCRTGGGGRPRAAAARRLHRHESVDTADLASATVDHDRHGPAAGFRAFGLAVGRRGPGLEPCPRRTDRTPAWRRVRVDLGEIEDGS